MENKCLWWSSETQNHGYMCNPSIPSMLVLCRPKDGISTLKDVKSKEDTSSDSEDKMAAINKNLMFGKRKPDLLMDGGEVVEKRKKGRPRKDKMAAPIAQPFTQVEMEEVSVNFREIPISLLIKHLLGHRRVFYVQGCIHELSQRFSSFCADVLEILIQRTIRMFCPSSW